jgi:hypothetical protein
VLMGSLLRPSIAIGGVVSPASLAIVVVWVIGVYVIDRARKEKRWTVTMPGSRRGRLSHREPMPAKPHPYARSSTLRVALIFGAACVITLAAGVALEVTGNTLADRAGINGVIFGATVLAAATGPARDQLRHCCRTPGRQRACARGHLRWQRVSGLPLPPRRPDRRLAGTAERGPAEQLGRLARSRADGNLRDRDHRPSPALLPAAGPGFVAGDRRLRARDRGAYCPRVLTSRRGNPTRPLFVSS